MLRQESILNVADNSGAKKVLVIRNLGGSVVRSTKIGDIVVCSIKKAIPWGTLKKKAVVRAVIVRTRNPIKRRNGNIIRFSDNACVIIDKEKRMIGTRIFGSIGWELKEKGFNKIVSLASEVL